MRFTEITDDLTGAADSGSYFTARRQQLKICTSGESSLNRSDNELLSVNLCSRNVEGEVARRVHSALLKRHWPYLYEKNRHWFSRQRFL